MDLPHDLSSFSSGWLEEQIRVRLNEMDFLSANATSYSDERTDQIDEELQILYATLESRQNLSAMQSTDFWDPSNQIINDGYFHNNRPRGMNFDGGNDDDLPPFDGRSDYRSHASGSGQPANNLANLGDTSDGASFHRDSSNGLLAHSGAGLGQYPRNTAQENIQFGQHSQPVSRKRGPSSPQANYDHTHRMKFARPTPSPLDTAPHTPPSHDSAASSDEQIPEEVLAALGGDAGAVKEMRRAQRQMEEQRKREAEDAEYARRLAADMDPSPPQLSRNSNAAASNNSTQYQSVFDSSGRLQRDQPIHTPVEAGSFNGNNPGSTQLPNLPRADVSLTSNPGHDSQPVPPSINTGAGNLGGLSGSSYPQPLQSNNFGPQQPLLSPTSSSTSSGFEEIAPSYFVPNDRTRQHERDAATNLASGVPTVQPGPMGWGNSAPGVSPITHRSRPIPNLSPLANDIHGAAGSNVYGENSFSNDYEGIGGLLRDAISGVSSALTPSWLLGGHPGPSGLNLQEGYNPFPTSEDTSNPYGYLSNPYRSSYRDYMMFESVNSKETEADIKDLVNNIRPDNDMDEGLIPTPEDFAVGCELYPHQKLGLEWMKQMEDGSNKGGILADDMGLGKTIQAIALMVSRRSTDLQQKTTLIVAPVALLRQWESEIKSKVKPDHRLSTYIYHGYKKNMTWNQLKRHDVVLTTYGTLGSEYSRRERIEKTKRENLNWVPKQPSERLLLLDEHTKFHRVILDEAQNIRNKDTKAFKAVSCLQSKTRFCMTGTPMMNSVTELYALISFLKIRPYNEYRTFAAQISRPLKSTSKSVTKNAMTKLHAILKAILLRRTKQSKIKGQPILNLPPRETITDYAILDEDQLAFYQSLETKTQLRFNRYLKAGKAGQFYGAMLLLLLRLRQACCHPHLIRNFEQENTYLQKTPEELQRIAHELLSDDVVRRIIEEGSSIDCPICMDVTENSTIFTPCGHRTCSECYTKISDDNNTGMEVQQDYGRVFKCMSCRGDVETTKVTDWNAFNQVHAQVEEEDNILKEIGLGGSPADSDSETDSDKDSEIDSEVDNSDDKDSLDDFIAQDDEVDESGRSRPSASERKAIKEEDSEGDQPSTASAGKIIADSASEDSASFKPKVKVDVQDECDSALGGETPPDRKGKGKAKEKAKADGQLEKVSDGDNKRVIQRKKKGKKAKHSKSKSKGKEKVAKSKKPVKDKSKSLSELQNEGKRNIKAQHKYFQKLKEGWISSAKIDKVIEILERITSESSEEKTIIFSQFTTLLDLVEVPLSEKPWGYTRYDGSMTAVARNDAVLEFTNRKRCRVMLVSLKAGNSGLNLTAANHVVLLDPFWNPYVEEQAIDRAHRIGQRKTVYVHRILVENTVEDRIVKIQERKKDLIEGALDENAQQSVARLGVRDLAYIFGVNP